MNSLIIGATGPVDPPRRLEVTVDWMYRAILGALKPFDGPPTEVHTGAAYGIDTQFFHAAVKLFPNAKHVVHVPRGMWHNTKVVPLADEVVYVDGGYMKRNDSLVSSLDLLLAFPSTKKEQQRSGTWATVRRARKQGVEVVLIPLSLQVASVH